MALEKGSLRDTVNRVFEIDSYASKMGEDESIVTISFSTMDKYSAEDLAEFIEKGYNFVLDADATTNELDDGTHRVFVEIERSKDISEQIKEILEGVRYLVKIKNFKFRYYKSFRSHDATQENLEEIIPKDEEEYKEAIELNRMNNYKQFFDQSFIDSIQINENTITFRKKFADSLTFEFIDFGDKKEIIPKIEESFDPLSSYPEIMFLTKYLGDYNISKFGEDKIVFENQGKALVLRKRYTTL